MYKWQKIKALQRQGKSIKEIMRIVKLSRNTVRKYI
ncbi:MAG: transposase, partial [Deltaproteobacteria bacterium]